MANSLFDITDKVIVVTGAGGILAGTLARYLLKEGANVVFLELKEEMVSKIKSELADYGGKMTAIACNVLDRSSLEAACSQVIAKYGHVDVLINGAGGNRPGAVVQPDQTIFDLDLGEYGAVLDLNLKGTLLPTMVFAKSMAERKSGVVINFSSMSAGQALTRVLGYSNAKGAIDNFTRWMAVEMATKFGDGVRVNAIAPGFFLTYQNKTLMTNPDGSLSERAKQVMAKTPMRRFGEPEEILGCIHFLISDAAKFVTGTVIPVDGGFSAFTGV